MYSEFECVIKYYNFQVVIVIYLYGLAWMHRAHAEKTCLYIFNKSIYQLEFKLQLLFLFCGWLVLFL